MSSFQSLEIKKQLYPLFMSLEKKGLFAYSSRFMVKIEDLSEVEKLIAQFFHKGCLQEK